MKLRSLLLVSLINTMLFAISNEEVSTKAYTATGNYKSSISDMKMILKDANNNINTRALSMLKLEGNNGDKTLIEFESPADVKGTKLLTHEHLDRNDDQWLYMPSIRKIKRIVSRNKSGSFMGSEFSYEDLSSQHFRRFSYEGDAQEVVVDGKKLYKSLRKPIDENSGYSKEVIWVEPKDFLIQQIDYFDQNGNHLKTAHMSKYHQDKGVWRVGQIEMKNVQTKKETTLLWKKEKIRAKLSERKFSKNLLRR